MPVSSPSSDAYHPVNLNKEDDDEEEEIGTKRYEKTSSDTHGSEFIDISGPKHVGCRQQFTDCSNVFKAFIGSAMIGLPFAVSQSGIVLCIVGVFIIATATDHCCHLIVKCKREVIRRIAEEKLSSGADPKFVKQEEEILGRTLSFGRIGKACMGQTGLLLVNISIMVTQFGFCIGYFIFLGNTMRSVIYHLWPNTTMDAVNISTSIPIHTTLLPTTLPPTTLPTFATTVNSSLFNNTIIPTLVTSSNETIVDKLSRHLSNFVEHTLKQPLTPHNLNRNSYSTFAILVALPIPILILISFIRNLRKLGPVSMLANGSLTGAFTATAVYMLATFKSPHETIKLVNLPTFPVFFGQVTGAFEGIGTVIPIEGSMAENRGRYPCYLHMSIALLSTILAAFGIIGYLCYGHEVHQIITQDLHGPIAIVLQIALFLGVLFTYPLQIYPCVLIVESIVMKYRRWKASKRTKYNGFRRNVNSDSEEEEKLIEEEKSAAEEKPAVARKVSTWEGNFIRACLIIITAAIALVFRDMFAYISALTGSIGSSLLSYILPCVFHIALKKNEMSRWVFAKDIFLIMFGIVGGIMGVAVTIQEIVKSFTHPHPHMHKL